ncbi:unnamed protein product [Ranitomeya imitator]|uniref:Leucyl/cystinyl aminopeptidase n=1 Tax=Ranitomeya imitator TaxID=111125 RepID=A0ABN9LUR4_9NEOB|nr:unnamed protein product [Ranitomeya imitator]
MQCGKRTIVCDASTSPNDRAQLPRNMIENSMFEEEPDVVDIAKEHNLNPLESEDVEYEPRSSRLLVRGLGEHELDEDEEDYESSARLLGMSFMNRSSGLRNNAGNYRQVQEGLCPAPSVRTVIVSVVLVVILVSIVTVIYLLPKCTFTKEGCHNKTRPMELVYPIATNGQLFPWTKSRLPTYIKPLEYDITLFPNLTTLTFSGKVNIKLNIIGTTNAIVLHSSGLHDIQANVILPGGSVHNLSVLEYPTFEMIAMVLPETLTKGAEYLLSIEYQANLSSSYYGFYKISYKDEHDNSTWLAATQFEPLAARKAFPCFDEPAFKSTFRLKIRRSAAHVALSNMPKINTTDLPDGLVLDDFATSVKMSTYLVAIIVSDMKNVTMDVNGTLPPGAAPSSRRLCALTVQVRGRDDAYSVRGALCLISQSGETPGPDARMRRWELQSREVSVYAIPQRIDQAEYALKAAVTLLEFFSNYFRIKYPLGKLGKSLPIGGHIVPLVVLYKQTLSSERVDYHDEGEMGNSLADPTDWQDKDGIQGKHRVTKRGPALSNPMFTLVTGIVGRWRAVCVTALQRPNSDAAAIRIVVWIAAASFSVKWFGNLVTMEWWNDLWLNEGFATYMEYFALQSKFQDLNAGRSRCSPVRWASQARVRCLPSSYDDVLFLSSCRGSDHSQLLRTAVLCSVLNRADRLRLRRSRDRKQG